MARLNRTCKVCGKKYRYCPSCDEDMNMPKWRAMFHDENCMKIFNILSANGVGRVSDIEAKRRLSRCDISAAASFDENIKNHIDVIMKSGDKPSQKDHK